MQRVPEIQKRVRSRREGVSLDRAQADMLALVGQKEAREREQELSRGAKKAKGVAKPPQGQRLSRRFSNLASIYDNPATPGATTEELPTLTEEDTATPAPAPRFVPPSRQKSVNKSGFGSSVLRGQSDRHLQTRSSESNMVTAPVSSEVSNRAMDGHKQGMWTPGMLDEEALSDAEEDINGLAPPTEPVPELVASNNTNKPTDENVFLASFLDDAVRANLGCVRDEELTADAIAPGSDAAVRTRRQSLAPSLATPPVMRRMTLLSRAGPGVKATTVGELEKAVPVPVPVPSAGAPLLGRARRQSISTHTSYREHPAGVSSSQDDMADSPRDEAYIDWGEDPVFDSPGSMFKSGLGSNFMEPVAFEKSFGAEAGPSRSPDSLAHKMYTSVSAPVLIPAFPRRDTSRVNIAMIHERDAILLPVDTDCVCLDAELNAGSPERPESPSRRGMAGDVAYVRKTRSAHGREGFTEQFKGKEQSLLLRTLSVPGQFDPTAESLALLAAGAKPLVLDDRVSASALRKNYSVAQRASAPQDSPLNVPNHSSSVLELTSNLDALGVDTAKCAGALDDMNDDDSTQVGNQAFITRSMLRASAVRVSPPASPGGSRPHSPKLFDLQTHERPATSGGGSVYNHSIAQRQGRHVYSQHPSNRPQTSDGDNPKREHKDTNDNFFQSIDRKLRKLSRHKTIGDRPREPFRHVKSSLGRLAAPAQASFVPSMQFDASIQLGPQSKPPPPTGKFELNEGVEIWRAGTMDDTLGSDSQQLQSLNNHMEPSMELEGQPQQPVAEEQVSRPHTADEVELKKGVLFSAVVVPVRKTLKELAGIRPLSPPSPEGGAAEPSSHFNKSSKDGCDDSSLDYIPGGRTSLFAKRLRALRATQSEAARPTTAPALLLSPDRSVVPAPDGVDTCGSIASVADHSAVSATSSVRTLTNFTGNTSVLPEGTVVQQPGLVISSRYSAGPVNLSDDFSSPPGKSGSLLRTYDQDRSQTVPVPVPAPGHVIAGLDDMSLDLCLGGSSSVVLFLQGGDKTKVPPPNPVPEPVDPKRERVSKLQSSSAMLQRLMNSAKERKPKPKPPITFVETQCPWVPDGALMLSEHNNSNQTLGYNDHLMIYKHELDGTFKDPSVQNQVVRQQNRHKTSFEKFASEKIATSHRNMKVSSAPLVANTKQIRLHKGPKRI